MFPLSGRRTAAAVIVWFLALVTPLAAQEPPPEFELPDVISPGRRPQPAGTSPAYVTAIPGEELRRMGFLTLGEALAFVAEAYVRITGTGLGGVQQASIRGSTPQQVLVLLDGVPLNATAQFGVNLATITLADVERVEVLRGPYSAIQGNFAVIQVTTRSRPGRTAVVSSGSYGTLQTALRLDGGTAGLRFGLGSEIAATSGYRPNGDATRWTGSGRLAWGEASRGMFSLSVHRTTGDAGVPGPTYFPSLSDRLADGRTAVAFEWARKAADGSRLLRIWSLEDTLRSTSPDFGFVSESMGSAVGAEWQQVARLGHGGIFTWGLEWQQASFALQSTFSAFSSNASSATGYAQYDLPLGGRTLVGAGLRYEAHSVYGGRLDPRAGFVYFVSPTLRLRGGLGRTSRAPSFGELFFPFCSNPALRPEQAWATDLGLEAAARPGLLVRVNGFYTDAQNLIIGGCNPQNIGSARVAGLSAEVVGRLSDRWSIMWNLTVSDGIDRTTGLSLLRVPPAQANLVLRHSAGGGIAISLLANFVSERPDLDFSTFPATRMTLQAYATIGLRVERMVRGVTIRVGVDNLLDAQYETLRGFPAPGRTYFVQLGGSF